MKLVPTFIVLLGSVAATPGYIYDKSCTNYGGLLNDGFPSAFSLAQAGADLMTNINANGNGATWQAQSDLISWLFDPLLTNGRIDKTKLIWNDVLQKFREVTNLNQNNNQPQATPSDYSTIGKDKVIIYCDYKRFDEDKRCSGVTEVGIACDLNVKQAVNMDEVYKNCKNPPKEKGALIPKAWTQQFIGAANVPAEIQLCLWYLEQQQKSRIRTLAAQGKLGSLAKLGAIFMKPLTILKDKFRVKMDVAATFDHTLLHEMTHSQGGVMATDDTDEPHSYGWINVVRLGTSGTARDSISNADNYAYFGLAARMISPPQGTKALRPMRDGSIRALPANKKTNPKRDSDQTFRNAPISPRAAKSTSTTVTIDSKTMALGTANGTGFVISPSGTSPITVRPGHEYTIGRDEVSLQSSYIVVDDTTFFFPGSSNPVLVTEISDGQPQFPGSTTGAATGASPPVSPPASPGKSSTTDTLTNPLASSGKVSSNIGKSSTTDTLTNTAASSGEVSSGAGSSTLGAKPPQSEPTTSTFTTTSDGHKLTLTTTIAPSPSAGGSTPSGQLQSEPTTSTFTTTSDGHKLTLTTTIAPSPSTGVETPSGPGSSTLGAKPPQSEPSISTFTTTSNGHKRTLTTTIAPSPSTGVETPSGPGSSTLGAASPLSQPTISTFVTTSNGHKATMTSTIAPTPSKPIVTTITTISNGKSVAFTTTITPLPTFETITTGSSSTLIPITIVSVTKSGTTSPVTYVSTHTGSGTIKPTDVWKCTGPLCDTGSICIIPLFCPPGHSDGSSWGLCCGWDPVHGSGPLPAGGPKPGPPPSNNPPGGSGSGSNPSSPNPSPSNNPTSDDSGSKTDSNPSSGTGTKTDSNPSSSTDTSTESSSSSCSSKITSACKTSVSVFTPSGKSTASSSTITLSCSSITACSASLTGTATTATQGSVYTVIGDDFDQFDDVIGTSWYDIQQSILEEAISDDTETVVTWAGDGTTDTGATATKASSGATTAKASDGTTTKASGGTTTKAPSATSTIKCSPDGAPWFSPTTWCECSGKTLPALPSASKATGINCAYTSLPKSTISPVSTGTPPTNIPGQGGVPGCAAVIAVTTASPTTPAYCNCGGTPAPTLSPTDSGFINCDYTVQPTSSYNPTPSPPPSSTTSTPPYATGQCNAHVQQFLGTSNKLPVYLVVNITDAKSTQIGYGNGDAQWGKNFDVDSDLPLALSITPQIEPASKVKRLVGPIPTTSPQDFENGAVDFVYGSQMWDTGKNGPCSVGGYDNGGAGAFFGALIFGDENTPNRQMDCKFTC